MYINGPYMLSSEKTAELLAEVEGLLEMPPIGEVGLVEAAELPRSLSVCPRPTGLLVAGFVPQHVDQGRHCAIWTLAGDHLFYCGKTDVVRLIPGALVTFYDGHPHSLVPDYCDLDAMWVGLLWERAAARSIRGLPQRLRADYPAPNQD